MIGIEPEKMRVQCHRCGGFNTYENTRDFGRTVMSGIYCADCGDVFGDGTESPHSIYKVRIKNLRTIKTTKQ